MKTSVALYGALVPLPAFPGSPFLSSSAPTWMAWVFPGQELNRHETWFHLPYPKAQLRYSPHPQPQCSTSLPDGHQLQQGPLPAPLPKNPPSGGLMGLN